MMNKHKIPNGGKKGLSKINDGFQKDGFRPYQPDKGSGKDYTQNNIKGKDQKGIEPFLNPDSQPQKHPMKKGMSRPGNQTIGVPVTGLMIPGLQMLGGSAQKPVLYGWWQLNCFLSTIEHPWCWILAAHARLDQERRSKVSRSMHGIMALRTEFCLGNKSFVVANSETEIMQGKVALFNFVLPKLMCLRQVMCP